MRTIKNNDIELKYYLKIVSEDGYPSKLFNCVAGEHGEGKL